MRLGPLSLAVLTDKQKQQLLSGAQALGLALSEQQIEQFGLLAALLEAKNKVLNLTRIKPEDYVTLHFLDSLLGAKFLGKGRILDVGTGAGFPGLPLAIVCPQLNFNLIDGTNKKIVAVAEFVAALGLNNVTPRHARAEDLANPGEKFDLVFTRAVAPLAKLVPLVAPLLAPHGHAIAYKGPEIETELDEAQAILKSLNLSVKKVEATIIPGTDISRTLVDFARSR